MHSILLADKNGRLINSWRSSHPKPENFPLLETLNPGDRVYRFEEDEDFSDYQSLVHDRLHDLEVEDEGEDVVFIDHAPERAPGVQHFTRKGRKAFRVRARVIARRAKPDE